MIDVMNSLRDPMKGSQEKCLDPQLWHACAGGMVRMPPVSSKVFYFPQGHAENAYERVDFGNLPVPAMVLCRVLAIEYKADAESDEVFAKIRLIPLKSDELDYEDCDGDAGFGACNNGFDSNNEKTPSFAKTLTQSDANNGGGFSVPRYCAETIFPRLDYSAEPPVQTILAKDVHAVIWKFRHIYRGTPRRHLLTTGWSNFVNQKKLVAGDSIVFMRAEIGDLCVGIRRAKRGGIGSGSEFSMGWNPVGGSCGYASLLREADENGNLNRRCYPEDRKGKVTAESVLEAVNLAISGRPFEAVYYPRASTSEFCVKASDVRAALRIPWCLGMRFKMAFETEDSSRISWFMGTVSSVNVSDPIRWPNSPWRLLQVAWDEPDLLQNVKRVNPWLVELVSNIPAIPFSSYSPPRKKMRLPQHSDYNLINSIPIPSFSSNHLGSGSPLGCVPDNIPVGLQGARHAQYELSSSDLHHLNMLPPGFFPIRFQGFDRSVPPLGLLPSGNPLRNGGNGEKGSCFLTMGSPSRLLKDDTESKKPHIVLFGKLILPEEPKPENESADTNPEKTPISSGASNQNGTKEISSSDERSPCSKDHRKDSDAGGLETGHCKVFIESDNVGRTLDLSVLGSYEELCRKLSDMFGIENPEKLSSVLYCDASGAIKYAGKEPFSEFLKTARRLTVLTDQGSENVVR
ncbi:PREDICTED: auxin response factor 16-like [Tarenaya hassleriana]|uniref:auxin response factor 16-like n=1 Tax=Tarenaya hassleriana TaxID=28532 RepID=UPI00053C7ECB|nr:PREDICTED: auxin response factor 16-like [Tarenaya hassleriana]XP_010558752.1 PREDICTED: auxin response factor 16-like [Tarenaya hassleriana]